ncbi:outer membrane lipoprotein [Piscirickettsia salmonis]|uniref:BON domain protein n=2 Tax=Piscirickettsia salmonis TaxID=1238 RepID=A0A1L6TDQ8_PISSA|nr:BON domain-containing protein [Piscirickettsia salmonis]AKP74580.2 osmotic-shock protection protein [Piscirickettsia salmonis LF-89 = ATCC VR-1361]ALB23583.1 BON domain protein [Piscirickettsia salmonis]ALY03450.1 osmotic-shock protection protein [Piscirickettsia salmonis]AMA43014.1 osmotic-shock protection protein [Piscirickettsia salmonis]AOS35484.1 osmotic-shock protection protein [Piscirickettsia salmonis]
MLQKKSTKLTLLASSLILSSMTLQGCIPAVIAVSAAASGAYVAHNRNSPSGVWNDVNLAYDARQQMIKKMPQLEQGRAYNYINFTAYNGALLITGQVANQAYKDQITRITLAVKPRVVYNQLTLSAPQSTSQAIQDSWITTKVKTRMVGKVDPTRVKVVTQNGIVYLLGIITPFEAAAATQVARTTDGVRKVVKVFDYIKQQKLSPEEAKQQL